MAFSDKMHALVNKGIAASRDIASKASFQAHTWGEMGVLKVELIQLRSQAEKLTTKLGAEAYAALAERGETVLKAETPAVRELLNRITELGKLMEDKEAAFQKLGGKESDLE